MYEVTVKNLLLNSKFKKKFNSPYLLKEYLTKIKYSKKLQLLWIDNLC